MWQTEPIPEIDVLWITAGLGCDGDTIAMTAATQPSIEEDIVLGAIPWIPKVRFHNPFLAYDNGEEFMRHFHLAAEGKAFAVHPRDRRFHSPMRTQQEGRVLGVFWDGSEKTGQPILTCDWIDRLAPNAWAIVAAGTCATYGGIHAMEGNPTGCMGLPDYLGWKCEIAGWYSHRLRAGMPGAAGQFSWKRCCTC